MSRRSDFDAPTPGLPAAPPPARGLLRSRTVTLSPAQLLALHTTPVVLVPVEDADAVICPVDVTAAQDAAATDGVAADNPVGVGYATTTPWDDRDLELALQPAAGRWVQRSTRVKSFDFAAAAVGQPVVLSMYAAAGITSAAAPVTFVVLFYLV